MTHSGAIKQENLIQYKIGDTDQRSWGTYEVINTGMVDHEEFCEKIIMVAPQQALSLQKHQYRRELWEIIEGTLVVIVNAQKITLKAGESIAIPKSAPHCMINMSNKPVILREMQLGICREEDNDRLCDYANRPTVLIDTNDETIMHSVEIYKSLIALLEK